MRVTHVITRLIVGGAQENTVSSVLGLQRRPEWQVELCSGPSQGREGSLESAFSASPGTLRILPELVRPIHPLKDWQALRRLTHLFRAERPQIVHTHSGKAGVLGRLAAARAGVPVIIHTIHGPSFGSFQGRLANTVFLAAEKHAARVTDHFVSVAEAMTEQYLAVGIGRREQFTTIFSGFDLSPFLSATNDLALRASLGLMPNDFVIGKIARLTDLKGHDDLLTAAPALVRQCPQMKFLLVGDGPLRSRFEKRAQTLGLEKQFVFAGLVPPTRVPQLVGLMDVVVHLSAREGLPRALPQALAATRPVVAYDCDGAKEVCISDETGFLVPPGDTAQLTSCLMQLACDVPLRVRLGRRGQQLVKDRFAVDRMVADLHELYLRLVSAKGLRNQ